MKNKKHPLLLILFCSIVAVEGFGQYVHHENLVDMTSNTVQPGVVYSCLYLRDFAKGAANQERELQAFVNTKKQRQQKNEEELEFQQVDMSYFDDALFIGDSRTVGMSEYAGIDNASYAAEVGLSVYTLFEKPIVKLQDGSMGTLEQGLREKQYGKIYLMVGINELGTGTRERFFATYQEAVQKIQALQPDAIIFVQGILYVTQERSDSDEYINNPNIMLRNLDIAKLEDKKHIFYIDVNTVYSDGKGNLAPENTFDNVHLKAACYEEWKKFLLAHGIVPKDEVQLEKE